MSVHGRSMEKLFSEAILSDWLLPSELSSAFGHTCKENTVMVKSEASFVMSDATLT